jgi:hypothetical protein
MNKRDGRGFKTNAHRRTIGTDDANIPRMSAVMLRVLFPATIVNGGLMAVALKIRHQDGAR